MKVRLPNFPALVTKWFYCLFVESGLLVQMVNKGVLHQVKQERLAQGHVSTNIVASLGNHRLSLTSHLTEEFSAGGVSVFAQARQSVMLCPLPHDVSSNPWSQLHPGEIPVAVGIVEPMHSSLLPLCRTQQRARPRAQIRRAGSLRQHNG